MNGQGSVFFADVIDTRTIPFDSTFAIDVDFRVIEAFQGVAAGNQTIRFAEITAEDFVFRSGQRVLVFGAKRPMGLSTQCSQTRETHADDPDLEILRALAERRPGGLVEGAVTEAARRTNHPGLRVTLQSAADRRAVREVRTTDVGHFDFGWVAPGTYTLSLFGGQSFADQRRTITVFRSQRSLVVDDLVLVPRHP